MKTKFSQFAAVAALTLAAGAPLAVAAPSQLYFSQSAGWVDPTTDADAATFFDATTGMTFSMQGAALTSPPFPASTYAGMQWKSYNTAAVSSIGIASYNSDNSASRTDVVTPVAGPELQEDPNANNQWNENEFWIIDRLFQTNQVIQAIDNIFPDPLWIADTLANLRIFDDAVGGNLVFSDLDSPTRIRFWETVNTAPCVNPNPAGTTCNDIYKVLSTELDPLFFAYGPDTIQITFKLVPGQNTVLCAGDGPIIAPCTAASTPASGQIAIYTPEGQNSQIFVAMAWSVVPVPEPTVIGLFGAGMIGLGFAARRRLSSRKG